MVQNLFGAGSPPAAARATDATSNAAATTQTAANLLCPRDGAISVLSPELGSEPEKVDRTTVGSEIGIGNDHTQAWLSAEPLAYDYAVCRPAA